MAAPRLHRDGAQLYEDACAKASFTFSPARLRLVLVWSAAGPAAGGRAGLGAGPSALIGVTVADDPGPMTRSQGGRPGEPASPRRDEATADEIVAALRAHASSAEAADLARYFKTGPGEYGEGDRFLGLHLSTVSAIAKENLGLPVAELERLLESPYHEVRTTALSIMHQEASRARTVEARRAELFELYLRRHDRINNWDLVDLACRWVVGGYLMDKKRRESEAATRHRSPRVTDRTSVPPARERVGGGRPE